MAPQGNRQIWTVGLYSTLTQFLQVNCMGEIKGRQADLINRDLRDKTANVTCEPHLRVSIPQIHVILLNSPHFVEEETMAQKSKVSH